ncbi:hypothetical protein PVAP13_5KG165907 [Panicum virgatum]|uniref:Uncharacterized protein n=1 Tax=Panicum virgatum TaxID=38727 RepID=A0A8T0SHL9_PANVG|nr:hypothetical protein PVAP13_5KG165907 [Panicum virgatum]
MVVCNGHSLICLPIESSLSSLHEEGGHKAGAGALRSHQRGGTPTTPTKRWSYSQGSTAISPRSPFRHLRCHRPDIIDTAQDKEERGGKGKGNERECLWKGRDEVIRFS